MSLFDVPQEVLDARPQGAKDFDVLQGRWLIHHKKLAERLVGCETDNGKNWEVNWYMYFSRLAA